MTGSGPEGPPAGRGALALRLVLERWDEVAAAWDLGDVERSSLLGSIAGGPVGSAATYAPATAELRMRLVVEFAGVLFRALGDERRVRFWLRAPNARLSGATPLEAMSESVEWIRWLTRCAEVLA